MEGRADKTMEQYDYVLSRLLEKFADRYGPKKEEQQQNQTETKEDTPVASPG